MEHTWRVHGDASSTKRVLKACHRCRLSKKKCYHDQPRSHASKAKRRPTSSGHTPTFTTRDLLADSVDREGDLVPTSILADLSPAASPESAAAGPEAKMHLPLRQLSLQDPRSMLERFRFSGSRVQALSEHHAQYLRSLHCWDALPKSTTDSLLPIYATSINACVPFLDGNQLLGAYFTGKASNLLVKAVCMVACKTEEASPFLTISEHGPRLSSNAFADDLYQSLSAALDADLEADRLARIQILALMHTHHSNFRAVEESSKRLSQAIHDCFTLSLNYCEPGRLPGDEPSLLWWTLWTCDRINACIASRPMMLFATNMTIPRPVASENYRSRLVCAWLRFTDLLEQVYEIYTQPYEQDDWTGPFPSFEELCSGLDAKGFQKTHLAMLQLYYATIGMLSCRAGRPGTVSYARRTASADSLDVIARDVGFARLAPLPLVPYSVSLALTVAYRDLRDEFKPADLAMTDFGSRCAHLEILGKQWPTAAAMSRLGNSVLVRLQSAGPAESVQRQKGSPIRTDISSNVSQADEDGSFPMAYSDLDEIFGPVLDTSWTQLSQDSHFFAHLA